MTRKLLSHGHTSSSQLRASSSWEQKSTRISINTTIPSTPSPAPSTPISWSWLRATGSKASSPQCSKPCWRSAGCWGMMPWEERERSDTTTIWGECMGIDSCKSPPSTCMLRIVWFFSLRPWKSPSRTSPPTWAPTPPSITPWPIAPNTPCSLMYTSRIASSEGRKTLPLMSVITPTISSPSIGSSVTCWLSCTPYLSFDILM